MFIRQFRFLWTARYASIVHVLKGEPDTTTYIWNVKRLLWSKGPTLPNGQSSHHYYKDYFGLQMILLNKTTLMITGGVVYDPTAPHLHSLDNWIFTLNVVHNIWRRYPNLPFASNIPRYQNVLGFDKLGNRYFNC